MFVLGSGTAPATGLAASLELDWSGPAGCPDEAAVEAVLAQRLAVSRAVVEVLAEVEPLPQGYQLQLTARASGLERTRTLQAADCQELLEATVLIVSLLSDMAGDADEAQPDLSESAPGASLGAVAGARWLTDAGTLPAIGLGPELRFGLRYRGLQAELAFAYLLPQSLSVAQLEGPIAEFELPTGALSLCYAALVTRGIAVGPCLRGEYGRILADSRNVSAPDSGSASWLAGLVGLRAELELSRAFALELELFAGFPFDRVRFEVAGIGPLHQLSALTGRLQLGFDWRL